MLPFLIIISTYDEDYARFELFLDKFLLILAPLFATLHFSIHTLLIGSFLLLCKQFKLQGSNTRDHIVVQQFVVKKMKYHQI